jgi:hypothetical protein
MPRDCGHHAVVGGIMVGKLQFVGHPTIGAIFYTQTDSERVDRNRQTALVTMMGGLRCVREGGVEGVGLERFSPLSLGAPQMVVAEAARLNQYCFL